MDFIKDWEGHQEFISMMNQCEDEIQVKGTKYWYFKEVWNCVLCGRETVHRERRYTVKPKNPGDRMRWHEEACHDHFI